MSNKPYVYKLTHKATGQFYFGYREANKLPALDDLPKYQTSSTYIKRMGFDNFRWEIIAEFDEPVAAYDLEQKLISESFDHALCLNKHCIKDGVARFRPNIESLRKAHTGRVPSEETRRKLSEAAKRRKGRIAPRSEESKEKQRQAMTGRVSPKRGKTYPKKEKS